MSLRSKILKAVRLSLSKPVRVYDVNPPSTGSRLTNLYLNDIFLKKGENCNACAT
jgi:hypothetical protein